MARRESSLGKESTHRASVDPAKNLGAAQTLVALRTAINRSDAL